MHVPSSPVMDETINTVEKPRLFQATDSFCAARVATSVQCPFHRIRKEQVTYVIKTVLKIVCCVALFFNCFVEVPNVCPILTVYSAHRSGGKTKEAIKRERPHELRSRS